jgi:lipoate-protein ligase A
LLSDVLNVDADKIRSKAIRSVRSRVANLKEYVAGPMSSETFWGELRQRLFAGRDAEEYTLTESDTQAVSAIRAERYDAWEWTYGKSPEYSVKTARRYPGGKIEVFLSVKRGRIEHCDIRGDFLGLTPVSEAERLLEGVSYDAEAVGKALDTLENDPPLCFGSISKREFLDCMFS